MGAVVWGGLTLGMGGTHTTGLYLSSLPSYLPSPSDSLWSVYLHTGLLRTWRQKELQE